MPVRVVFAVLVGAVGGFGYHRVVGCRTGACPISSNAYVSTLYGAFVGYMMTAS